MQNSGPSTALTSLVHFSFTSLKARRSHSLHPRLRLWKQKRRRARRVVRRKEELRKEGKNIKTMSSVP
jgi:hypothetical protein